MVKVDNERDYYADLEIPLNSTTEDVKKQFRKLALKYHPDRHPGEELEWIPRFQAISAAHEILVDPEQRRKYDQVRRRSPVRTANARAPAPRGNPYQAYSDFPPPKMRTQTRPTPPTPSRGGADRYTSFPRPPPPQRDDTNTNNDARSKANFTAWQNMNNAKHQQPQRPQNYSQTPPSAPPRRPDGRFTSDQGGSPQPANTSAQRSAWEEANKPQANQSPYMRPPPPPPPPTRPQAPTAKLPDPLSSFRRQSGEEVPFTEGIPRVRTPYASNAGEKTYFSSGAIPRSASTRDSTRSQGDTHKRSSGDETRHKSSSPVSRGSDAAGDSRPTSGEPHPHEGQRQERAKPFSLYSSGSSDESDVPLNPYGTRDSRRAKSSSSRPMAKPSSSWAKRGGQSKADDEPEKKRGSDPIFTFPITEETFTRTSPQVRPPDAANINTNFTSTGVPPIFSSTGPPLSSVPRPASPTENSPTRGRESERTDHPPPLHAERFHPQTSTTIPPTQPIAGTFSADGWAKELQGDNWAANWAYPPPLGGSPNRNNASPKRSRPGSSRTPLGMKSQGSSSNDTDANTSQPQPFDTLNPELHRRVSHDSNAMDLDPEPPSAAERYAQARNGATQSPQFQPRQAYVQPERPSAPLETERQPSYPNLPGPPPGPPPINGERISSNINLDDLRQVPPLSGNTSGGINGMSDLSNELPFQSQPSTKPPTLANRRSSAPRIELPKPPKGPFPPQNLTQEQWIPYMDRLTMYNTVWNIFNTKMVSLLQTSAARFVEMDHGPEGGMINGWLGAVGETSTLGGWETYKLHMKEDERIRTYWAVSWEKHMGIMDRHDNLRVKVLRSGLPI